MKVKELVESLLVIDPEAEVVLAKDGEGNGFGSLGCVEADLMFNGEEGELRYAELTKELIEKGCSEEDVAPDGDPDWVRAVVLWP